MSYCRLLLFEQFLHILQFLRFAASLDMTRRYGDRNVP